MLLPTMAGVVERRLLVNYRVDPDVVGAMLPAPFRPQLVGGAAVAGICLIRLGRLRPAGLPGPVGMRTENAACRIAVEWDGGRSGVFIPQRYSASRATVWLGGRLFPGMHRRARFLVRESDERVRIRLDADDGTHLDVAATAAGAWPGSALFSGLDHASEFFRGGSAGYSVTRDPYRLDGLELRTGQWRMEACTLDHASSSFFEDPAAFPPGTAELDTAFLMRRIPVSWHALPALDTRQSVPC